VHVQRPTRRPGQKIDQGRSEHVRLERMTEPTDPTLVMNLIPRLVVQEVQATHVFSLSL
jgi:hypothetical protein